MEIFVSTGGKKNLTFLQSADLLMDAGINNIELSGGKHVEDAENIIVQEIGHKCKLMLHNYFPPPKHSFVLNLASEDFDIRIRSIEFVKEALRISKRIGSRFYGVHAGFCFDPKTGELGKVIKKTKLISKKVAEELFMDSIEQLAIYAKELDVRLLVENNVLSAENFKYLGPSSLLLVHPDEISAFFQKMDGEVGFLLDVGHLKVCANVLKFDLLRGFDSLQDFVQGYHLSENLGYADDHLGFKAEAWFIERLDWSKRFATLEIEDWDKSSITELVELFK